MIAILFLFLVSSTQALPGGAPTSVCRSMLPNHGGGIPPKEGQAPFSIVPKRQGGNVSVTVGSTLGVRFQGLLLQGRTPNGDILGEFQLASGNEAKVIDCAEPSDSITHESPSPKDYIEATWTPPRGFEGTVIFNATIAQSYDTFWVGVTSQPVEIDKRSIQDPIPSNPFRPNRPSTTTPPNFNPEAPRQASTDFDPFYDGCGVSKLCFGGPSASCVASKNCVAAVAVTVTGEVYDFELKADSSAAWVGVGLSDDNRMGEDSVIECVNTGSGVAAYMSWTSRSPPLATRLTNPQMGIQLLNGSVVDNALYCKIRRETVTTVSGTTFDLVNDAYHILIAAGAGISENSVNFHNILAMASEDKRALSDVSALAGASRLLIRLHGSFMLAAWIGTASIGILLARYYRQTWVGTSLMGKDLWFAWHRIFMVLTWGLTMAAFVLIFVELKEWSQENNPHAILGTITSVLCFFQPIGAYFRPHPGTPKRPIFNWMHWLVGNVAHIVAIVTIFFSVKLSKAQLPEFVDWILVAYVAVHVISHIVLSLMGCISEKSSESRVTSFPMKDLGGSGRSSAYADRNADAPFTFFRKFLLAIYILVVLLLVVSLIVITALAPIGDAIPILKSN